MMEKSLKRLEMTMTKKDPWPLRFFYLECFSGAGNLIFPPSIGFGIGQNFWPAIGGLVPSGVGIGFNLDYRYFKSQGYIDEISKKIALGFVSLLLPLILQLVPFTFLGRRPLHFLSGLFHVTCRMPFGFFGLRWFIFLLPIWLHFNPSKNPW